MSQRYLSALVKFFMSQKVEKCDCDQKGKVQDEPCNDLLTDK